MSVGGKSPHLHSHLQKRHEKSGSDSSDSEMSLPSDDGRKEDMNELFADQKKKRLNRVADSDTDESLSGSDYDSSSDERGNINIENDFIVDDEDKPIHQEQKEIYLSTSKTNIDPQNIDKATAMFGTQQKKAKRNRHVSDKVSIRDEIAEFSFGDDFERECERFPHRLVDFQFIEAAAEYIQSTHYRGRHADSSDFESLIKILTLLIKESCTPQYIISFCRSVYCNSCFNDDDIFMIMKFAKDFGTIVDSRQHIIGSIESYIMDEMEYPPNLQKYTLRSILASAIEATTLEDIHYYYLLQYSPDITNSNAMFRKRRDQFGSFVKEFLLDPMQFALVLVPNSDYNVDVPEPKDSVEDRIDDLYRMVNDKEPSKQECALFEDQIITYAAKELEIHPSFRKVARELIMQDIYVSTKPTERGRTSDLLKPLAKYGKVKRLKNKPILSFYETDLWLLIDQARNQGFIEVSIDYRPPDQIDGFIKMVSKKYQLLYNSSWDVLRGKVIDYTIRNYTWPQVLNEVEKLLMAKASEFVCAEVEVMMYNHLMATPYCFIDDVTKAHKPQSVFGFHYSEDDKMVYIVYVNEKGNVTEYCTLSNAVFRYSKEYFSREINWEQLINVKMDPNTPTDLVTCIKGLLELKDIVSRIAKTNTDGLVTLAYTSSHVKSASLTKIMFHVFKSIENIQRIYTLFIPFDTAIIYAHSECSETETRELSRKNGVPPPGILIAASAVRRLQNPLSEITRLWTSHKNHLLHWSLHPYQNLFIGTSENIGPIHDSIERACLKAVGKIGIDFFSLVSSHHHRGALQFIPGLGPKAADYIIKLVAQKSQTQIRARNQFGFDFRVLDYQHIKKNSFPFIRFPYPPDSKNVDQSVMDGLIIPLEFNDIASQLMKNYIEEDNVNEVEFFFEHLDDPDFDKKMSAAIDRFMSISNIDDKQLLEFIGKEIENGPFSSLRILTKKLSYSDIQFEYSLPNPLELFEETRKQVLRDRRCPYNCYPYDQIFRSMFPLYQDAFIKGMIITVDSRPSDYTDMPPRISHPSGIYIRSDGYFKSNSLGKKNEPETKPECVIYEVYPQHLTLIVTTHHSHFEKFNDYKYHLSKVEPDFDFDGESKERAKENDKEKLSKLKVVNPRDINHPLFRNINRSEAEAELSSKDIGAFLYRPSSKGDNVITLQMKFPFGTYAHYSIEERRVAGVNRTELVIKEPVNNEKNQKGELTFSDLEEIRWRFASKIQLLLRNIIKHYKWVEDPSTAESIIMSEMQGQSNQVPYRFTSSIDTVCTILLMWYPGTLIKEKIVLFEDKYYYQGMSYKTPESIIQYFKVNGYKQFMKSKDKK